MEEIKVQYPIVFVTGIGQTWSTLKGADKRWNLFPAREVMRGSATVADKARLAITGVKAVASCFRKKNPMTSEKIGRALRPFLKYCTADVDGNLHKDVDVRLYGARSFDQLGRIDFLTGEPTEDFSRSLMARVYSDIPCQELSAVYGEENMYCFNYPAFSDIYADAAKLRSMLEGVIADQTSKLGADKVVLIPMSMGATVVSAYLDKYYTVEGDPIGEDLVAKVVSIVGAWDGSDGLADLVTCNFRPDFDEMFYDGALQRALAKKPKLKRLVRRINRASADDLVKTVIAAILENVILNTTSFTALIPKVRYAEMADKLFTPARMKSIPRLNMVKAEADRYHTAQINLQKRMYAMRDKLKTGFYFIAGYGMDFGGEKSDFSFMSYFDSAQKTNSDKVIQISSTVPGTAWVRPGNRFSDIHETGEPCCLEENHAHLSPDGSVDASYSFFPETSWYFYMQEHELGHNNTALRLAGDIALGRVTDVHNEQYPQFNEARDVRGVGLLIEKAREKCGDENLTKDKKDAIAAAAAEAESMMKRTVNRKSEDDAVIQRLRAILV